MKKTVTVTCNICGTKEKAKLTIGEYDGPAPELILEQLESDVRKFFICDNCMGNSDKRKAVKDYINKLREEEKHV